MSFQKDTAGSPQNPPKSHDRLINTIGIIFIVVLIVAIVVPLYGTCVSFIRARQGGTFTQCQSNLKNMAVALEMFKEENQGEYPVTLSQLMPGYLRIIPTCTAAKKDTYSSAYRSFSIDPDKNNRDGFFLYCKGNHHRWVGIDENYPQYNSRSGIILRK